MRAVIQRVNFSKVTVNEQTVGDINKGFMVLIGIGENDTEKDIKWVADKILNLRVFEDSNGKMNLSLLDVKGELLLIPQFTLYGDCRKGRRPSFSNSASQQKGREYYEKIIEYIENNYNIKIKRGKFQTHMKVDLQNDGPVTLLLDSEKNF
ncbi:D-aminoacyl-tRNA deacylase [Geotoga petraea]|uniref:D-aminoacyl-tRNA deacylase n=1 Tax=Geotoga petraea TaxID=28234 RepID=A0A1G6JYX7_9BACT|nr:D-aminoacyl-tRNA deacylase [Geotoga petraea]MDK2945672.1 D-aminoacyl-tRNA deacylase [Geotoga sp.]TGG88348.1 D-tyrosyl-tRNA(Tyr) deacylase [Geotoga petraea]SDC23236.1 D-tyrosyl-tRNA(Tyr) deacylase [Geotoga petraea]